MENIETLLAAVAQTQGFDDDESAVSSGLDAGFGNSESSPGFSGDVNLSTPVGLPPPAGGRKRRGRPPKGQVVLNPPPPPPSKRIKVEDEEEDVCFVCFDGGSLVLCDRKGCPKAYHPACVKRDEAFFKSKAKWNCGWHICTVCRKTSYYSCYTCPYSLCKGCTKDADYLSVRGSKGFCSTCMKTIMLIENKDQANDQSIQVDFDDQTSWEYLFKMYWVCLKEKLSLTLAELTNAKNPWNPAAAVPSKRQSNNARRSVFNKYAGGGHLELNKPDPPDVTGEYCPSLNSGSVSSTPLELNKPSVDFDLLRADDIKTEFLSSSNYEEKLIVDDSPKLSENKSIPDLEGRAKMESVDNTEVAEMPCTTDKKSAELVNHKNSVEWASKELLEFVGCMKHGNISTMSQFDVQTMLLEYIKLNQLRDPHRKSQIICDSRLRNLFGKPRVGHIEMLKLLEYHFLIKEESPKNSFVPAGFVGSGVSDFEADNNVHGTSKPVNSRKQKAQRKSEDWASKTNSNDYAAIDIHNINLIYLRRNVVENLVSDQENFDAKVIGSIVRIRVASVDQKQDIYRLVQVVGTTKVSEPYKIGDRAVNITLEVLNLNKKEPVSIDAISNQDFTEDECKRLRQSIRCGLVKHFTVGELQKKAISLQAIKVNDWLETEIQRLNHLRDRASENGREKELREYVEKLQLLSSPEERRRRISEVPEVRADQKMSPDYVSEEDVKNGLPSEVQSSSDFRRSGRRNIISPCKKGTEEQSKPEQNRRKTKTADARGSHDMEKVKDRFTVPKPSSDAGSCKVMQCSGEEVSRDANSGASDHIETERLWHYRDPNGKIQGPFSMMQLRRWSITGLFPPDMRIWTNHEQYDSLLLSDALNGQFHGASEENGGESVQKLMDSSSDVKALSEKNNGVVRAEESSPSWPQCWDLLKDSSSVALSTGPEQSNLAQPDQTLVPDELVSHVDDKTPSGVAQDFVFGGYELEKQSTVKNRAGSNDMESGSVSVPVSKQEDDSCIFNHQSVSSVAPPQRTSFLELLSPTPRSNPEEPESDGAVVKTSVQLDLPVTSSGPSWSIASNLVLGGVQIPVEAEEWCGYSPTPAVKPSGHEWDSSIVISPTSSSKPPDVSSVQIAHPFPSHHAHNIPSWLATLHDEPIEFDALGEESVSDLLAEVDAMESQGALSSPNSALKFARELLEDCKDDCFSSIEEFGSSRGGLRSDALSSTGEIQLENQLNQGRPSPHIDAFDFFGMSSVHSSSSSAGETKVTQPVYDAGSEYHPEMVGTATTPPAVVTDNTMDPGWGSVQGNINLVTVQGNVNLVLGGPVAQEMSNHLGWGTTWVNPPNQGHNRNPSLPWDGQRKFASPREWGGYPGNDQGFGRGRLPWSRQQYGGSGGGNSGGYSRPLPKGQRVCKFYESGHCKKGSSCDYLHP